MEGHVFIGNNDPEDVKWLCSLSESELDMLISLKKLVIQHAKCAWHESMAKQFDLKMLRALGFLVMQSVEGQLKSQMTELNMSEDVLDGSNLLKIDHKYIVSDKTIQAFMQSVERRGKKRTSAGSKEVAPSPKKPKGN